VCTVAAVLFTADLASFQSDHAAEWALVLLCYAIFLAVLLLSWVWLHRVLSECQVGVNALLVQRRVHRAQTAKLASLNTQQHAPPPAAAHLATAKPLAAAPAHAPASHSAKHAVHRPSGAKHAPASASSQQPPQQLAAPAAIFHGPPPPSADAPPTDVSMQPRAAPPPSALPAPPVPPAQPLKASPPTMPIGAFCASRGDDQDEEYMHTRPAVPPIMSPSGLRAHNGAATAGVGITAAPTPTPPSRNTVPPPGEFALCAPPRACAQFAAGAVVLDPLSAGSRAGSTGASRHARVFPER